jgi:hypothetical protein
MASGTELFNAWKEGFEKKDSSRLAELLTDDFQMVSRPGTRSKQETLAWVDSGGNPTVIDNLEVLYENDEVAVIQHSANNAKGDGTAWNLLTKKDGKFSQARVMRTAVNRDG